MSGGIIIYPFLLKKAPKFYVFLSATAVAVY